MIVNHNKSVDIADEMNGRKESRWFLFKVLWEWDRSCVFAVDFSVVVLVIVIGCCLVIIFGSRTWLNQMTCLPQSLKNVTYCLDVQYC